MNRWKHILAVVTTGILMAAAFGLAASPTQHTTGTTTDQLKFHSPDGQKAFYLLRERVRRGETLSLEEKVALARLAAESSAHRGSGSHLDNIGGPDEFGYMFLDNQGGDSATFSWIELRGDPQTTWINDWEGGNHDDAVSVDTFSIGFNFPFYGENYSSFTVCTNGHVQFVSRSIQYWELCLPVTEMGPSIFLYGEDLQLDNGGIPDGVDVVGYRDFGDYFVIEFDSVGRWPEEGASFKFEAILFPSGKIKLQYLHMEYGGLEWWDSTGTIGIQESDMGTFLQYLCDTDGIQAVDSLAIWFQQPTGIPSRVTDLQVLANGTTVSMVWNDPVTDTYGNPITIDSVRILRDDQRVGIALPGVQFFSQTNVPAGSHVYSLRAYRGGWPSAAVRANVMVGNPSYYENFDVSNGGWVTFSGWEWGPPAHFEPHSAPNCWGNRLNGTYFDGACDEVRLNPRLSVVSANAMVEFYCWYETEPWSDGVNFQVSVDNDCTWAILQPTVHPYDSPDAGSECINVNPQWTGRTNGWQYVRIPLGNLIGQAPSFRFLFGSNFWGMFPGFMFDDVVIWGLSAPAGVSVSGTVTLDGGNGSRTDVVLRANGAGSPTANPNAVGAFTIQNVQTGIRTITASSLRYGTVTRTVTVPPGGLTGVNITLRRLPPPMPSGLTVSQDSTGQFISLDWNNSTDPTVDFYKVYRKVRTDSLWIHVRTATVSQALDTLTVWNAFQYAVAAVDTNLAPPALESPRSPVVQVLYGAAPPSGLTADGRHDTFIRLRWDRPGEGAAPVSVQYDDGSMERWMQIHSPNGRSDFFAVRFDLPLLENDIQYPLPLRACNIFLQNPTPLPDVWLCSDADGSPDMSSPREHWTYFSAESTPGWLTLPVSREITLSNPGSVWLVWQQPEGTNFGVGADQTNAQSHSYYSEDGRVWHRISEAQIVSRLWVGGDYNGFPAATEAALGHPAEWVPLRLLGEPDYAKRAAKTGMENRHRGPVAEREIPASFSSRVTQPAHPRNDEPYIEVPPLIFPNSDRAASTLDDPNYYIVYRDSVDVAHPAVIPYDNIVAEGLAHNYFVTAHYPDGLESVPTNTVTAMAAMAPGAPRNLSGTPLDAHRIRIHWTDPTSNEDGSLCTDLAGVRIFRNDTLIATVAQGAMQYVDTPPYPNRLTRWTVRGIDEVSNMGPGGTYVGSVIDQWQETAYGWIDISTIGTPIDLCDDCIGDWQPIGFPFMFYGSLYDSLRIASNGFVTFMDTWSASWNDSLPTLWEPNNAIYAFWRNLNPGAGGSVLYLSDSAAGVFVVSFIGVPIFDTDDPQTFQMVLYRDGEVAINYQDIGDITGCTAGVENETGTVGITVWNNGPIENTGFMMDDSTSLEFWGAPPLFCTVTGTVSFDGGAGALTAVTVQGNGASHPTAHPNAAGSYQLHDVVVGSRTFTASLAGYHTSTLFVAIPDTHGLTNQNFVLRRTNPPAPTGLVFTLNEITGRDNLHWDVSPDSLVDLYRVYRRPRGDSTWTLVRIVSPRTHNWAIDTLTADGSYFCCVTAVDTNVIPPAVESDRSASVIILFGELPPEALVADGHFDNKIRLSWLPPGVPHEVEVYYDSVDTDVGCIRGSFGFWEPAPFGWCVAHYQGIGPIRVSRIKAHFYPWALPGMSFEAGVFEDNDTGLPTFTLLGVTNAIVNDPMQWVDVELATPVTVVSGSFFVGIRQITDQYLDIGLDFCATQQLGTFFFAGEAAGPWESLEEAGFGGVLCLRAIVIGNISTGPVELSPSPVVCAPQFLPVTTPNQKVKNSGLRANEQTERALTKNPRAQATLKSAFVKKRVSASRTTERKVAKQSVRPYVSLTGDRGRHTLDEVVRFRIYRNGARMDSAAGTVLIYDNVGLVENQAYSYYVTAVYTNGQASPSSNTVTASCNMAPGAPTDMILTPVGTSQMRIQWTNPVVNQDGSACSDLAGVKVYRDGLYLGSVAPATGQYLDTPPDEMTFYTWEVRGYDEVPNEGPGASMHGAVISPWRTIDYEWQEVWNISTPVVECSFCASDAINLGFNFMFYGVAYQSVFINSNGYLTLENPYGWLVVDQIPNEWEPNAAIYGYSTDLDPSGGNCRYYSDPSGDRFIVTWQDCPHAWIPGAAETFQIILETEDGIIFNYQTVSDPSWCLIGIENQSGSDGLQLFFSSTGDFIPESQSAVQFWGGPSSSIIGTVRAFGSNQPITNVSVWATGQSDTALTEAEGTYELPIEDGTYTINFHHATYCDTSFSNVVVPHGGEVTRNAIMRTPAAGFSHTSVTFSTPVGVNAQINFTLSNPGGQCPLSYAVSDTSPWLTVNPTSSQVNPNQSVVLTVSANVQGIPANSERHSEFVITYNAVGSPHPVNVDLYVSSVAVDPKPVLPTEFAYYPNYPNPFNAMTTFAFDVPQESEVLIIIYNLTGQEVARPVSGAWAAGHYHVSFNAGDLPSGMYLVRMTAGDFHAVGKMLLLK